MRNKIIDEDINCILSESLPWEDFRNKTVLISGAAGFLPSYMVEVFLKLNDSCNLNIKVLGLVRDIEKAKTRFSHISSNQSLNLIEVDVCDKLINEIQGPIHFIIHAASFATPKIFRNNPVGTILPNIIGTNNLLELAAKNPIETFLFFSTSGVYGHVDSKSFPIDENNFGWLNPMEPAACYLESKRMGENLCVAWASQFGVPIKVVRPAITYGPGLDLNSGRSFEDFILNIITHKDIELYSDGSAIRNFCYISDAIYGFFLVLLKGVAGQAYNVATSEEVSIKELAEYLVEDVFPDRALKVIMRHDSQKDYKRLEFPRTTVSIDKMKRLGWSVKVPIKDGFRRVVESFENP